MTPLRRTGAAFCAALLALALLGFGWSFVVSTTLRNREAVKSWVNESGLYTNAVDMILEAAKKSSESGASDIPVDDPQIKTIAANALSPEFLQQTVEKALDGSYNWLEGSSATLDVNIDLTQTKQKLAEGLATYAGAKAAALPVCATNEPPEDFDAFNAVCRPRDLSPEAASQQVKDQLLNSKEFLENPVITANEIKTENATGQTVPFTEAEEAKAVKQAYQFGGLAPIILGLIVLATVTGIIFLSSTKLKGMRRVGYILATAGVLFSLKYWVLGFLNIFVKDAIVQSMPSQPESAEVITKLVNAVMGDIRSILLIFAVAYILIGVVLITVSLTIQKRRRGEPKTEDKPEATSEAEAIIKHKETETTSKPKVQKERKIQL